MTAQKLREITTLSSRATAALIPLANGGKDGDGRLVVDAATSIQTARECLMKALELLEEATQ